MIHITELDGIPGRDIANSQDLSMTNDKNIIIFLVDDNELHLKSLEVQFKENPNLDIRTFLTGEECLKSISLKPDIIVLDYFLDSADKNAMDGLKTLILIKGASPETQVIMSSAHQRSETAVNCLKQGAFDYIVKDEKIFFKLKQIIKKIIGKYAKGKEPVVWDW